MDRLSKASRFLDSVRGTDKVFMLIQYVSKIAVWKLKSRHPESPLAVRIQNLAAPISDTRVLLRYYGLIPLVRWIIISELDTSTTPVLRWLVRLQNAANLAYYPLEHIYWLASHKVISMDAKLREKIGMWSCRFWAAYVVLYFMQLGEEYLMLGREGAELQRREAALGDKPSGRETWQLEKRVFEDKKHSWLMNTVINSAYFPMTIHWSLENSPISDVSIGVLGTIAALAQLHMTWRSS
ncbi:peroxisomal biogenesis factor 11 [Polychytrium aggregatum]|uniref:peroxisomal biogenesis factor 11 n=1 Tax=Polychytrium aggregatum TaxID=110093 RepID=UPI0022FE5EE4|nr:peroxisomal biogenesis factor 11 [Polychytrium aggregatum]KAI9203593.1 peroxisomal biogenesis factor 11 [Polychytrium aggregatum]